MIDITIDIFVLSTSIIIVFVDIFISVTIIEQKFEGNVQRFLENMVHQLQKVMDAAKVVEEKKSTEVPKDFTPPKYRVKAMPKLNAKKITVKKMTAVDLAKRLEEGKDPCNMDINFKEPMLITNATSLFAPGAWDEVRRHWTAMRMMEDPYLEKEFRIEYWPQDKARARMVGNQLHMEEPEMIPFSRYVVNCFHGTPAKPKLPGQNTEHCEQTVDAQSMVHNTTELEQLRIFKTLVLTKIENALPHMAEFRRNLLEAAGDELKAVIGKGADRWKRNKGRLSYQYFTFGPSGSGANLRPENGLPFFDVLLHGSKRWLLLQEDLMERVASKAREAGLDIGRAPPSVLSVPTPVRSQKRRLLAPAASNSATVEVPERAETADACATAGKAYLYDDEGRRAQITPTWETLVEVEHAVPCDDWDSGRAFAGAAPAPKLQA
eukprot:s707_g7.t2